jgi:gamma-glutamylcysteine synthetase
MNTQQLRRYVARLFPSGGERTTRVGIEHELMTAEQGTGAVVPIARIQEATRNAGYAAHLGFEPGGQVELSLPHAPGPAAAHQLRMAVSALRADCELAGIRLDATPVDPRCGAEVPLQLTSPRYLAMQRHFDSIGPAGRTMMRRTASTQLCLDWWPGRAGLEQWRLLQLAGPLLAAGFARSAGADSRLATWLAVDPGRTAFDGRLLQGDDPVAAYADFAGQTTVFTERGDVAQHLTTLFPPVRPRGTYLEVRFLDVQPLDAVDDLVGVLSNLLYDGACRREAIGLVGSDADGLGDLWTRAAAGDPDVTERGRELLALARGDRRLGGVA